MRLLPFITRLFARPSFFSPIALNPARCTQGANLKVSPGPPAPAPAGGSAGQFRGQARLPRFAAPRHYELRLRPDLVACTFSGSVAITVAVSASTRFLVLNAADLSIKSASIRFQVRIRRE
jgi:puromycin-sensitive aminopeptidase